MLMFFFLSPLPFTEESRNSFFVLWEQFAHGTYVQVCLLLCLLHLSGHSESWKTDASLASGLSFHIFHMRIGRNGVFFLFLFPFTGEPWLCLSSVCPSPCTCMHRGRRRPVREAPCSETVPHEEKPMASGPPLAGRRLQLLEFTLAPLLLLLVSGLEPVLAQKVYTNTWAVHIPGGQAVADQVASKHGFRNYGHVSCVFRSWNLCCCDTVK